MSVTDVAFDSYLKVLSTFKRAVFSVAYKISFDYRLEWIETNQVAVIKQFGPRASIWGRPGEPRRA